MDFSIVVSLVTGICIIAGVGWKLNAELSKIRIMIEVFMGVASEKWKAMDKIGADVHELQEKVAVHETDIKIIRVECASVHNTKD